MATTTNTVTLGLVQHASPGFDKAKNLATATRLIREAASKGAQIVATQELFLTSYFCQVESDERFKLAEPIPGPTTEKLCDLAKKLKIYLTASLFEKRAQGVFHNTSVMIDPRGEIIGKYRKMHIPDDPRFFEKYYFTPGDLGFQTQTVAWKKNQEVKTGMLVCWDQWSRSAGITRKRPSIESSRRKPGRRSRRPTRSPTACSSRRSTASASRTTLSSGAAVLSATPVA
jgi:N-carbamoylputrescine amidase